ASSLSQQSDAFWTYWSLTDYYCSCLTLPYTSLAFFFHSSHIHRALHSFPTRRSSDLRPSSGRLKKLDPGTGETPISLVSQTENRSEEHTSELQSRGHLVCRLLLEKKKNQDNSLAAALGFHQPRQLPRLTHHTYRHACP